MFFNECNHKTIASQINNENNDIYGDTKKMLHNRTWLGEAIVCERSFGEQ